MVSSFNLQYDPAFSGRIDVLAGLPPGTTLNATGAAVLSARFPYVTPGGSLPRVVNDTSPNEWDLFVDGGYFDNSGAGLVLEMLVELRNDSALAKSFRRFWPMSWVMSQAVADSMAQRVQQLDELDSLATSLRRWRPLTDR